MKKYILGFLVSANCYASVSTVSHMFPISYLHRNTNRQIESSGGYSIVNESNNPVDVSICYEITTCPEYQIQTRHVVECEYINVPALSSKSDSKHLFFTINYNFGGWCTAVAKTTVNNGLYSVSSNSTEFQVGN